MGDATSLKLRLLICILLVIITFAAFHQVLRHDFVNYDDDRYVYRNEWVQHGLTAGGVKWAFSTLTTGLWQPMVWLSWMADTSLFGVKAWGYHLTNLLIHIANVLLLFLVLQMMTGKPWRSAFVALLFGIHPLHVESVAWVTERKDVLSALFWLLTMWAYVRYVRKMGVGTYMPVLAFFALGLMAKPMLVSVPFVLLLLDYWPFRRIFAGGESRGRGLREVLLEKAPLVAMAGISSVISVRAEAVDGSLAPSELFGFGVRAANAVVSYVSYIVNAVWPARLAVPYIHPGNTIPTWQVLVSALALLVISVLAFTNGRRYPVLAVGWLWYVVTLIPMIGLVQIGWHGMADRYTYMPLIGVFIVAVWGVPDLCAYLGRKGTKASGIGPELLRRVPAVAGVLVLMVLFPVTLTQAGYWKNSITLFEHTIKVRGDNAVAHSNLGTAYFRAGQHEKAVYHFRKSIEVEPHIASVHFSLASALYTMQRLDEAAEEFSATLDIDPSFPDARSNLDIILAKLSGQPTPDLEDPKYRKALEHFNLGMEMTSQRRVEDAIREYEEAIRIKPDFAEAHCNLGMVLSMTDDTQGAIRECREAIRLNPKFAPAHINLAVSLMYAGDYAGAWKEIHLGQKYGGSPSPKLLEVLASRMPEPAE